MRGTNVDDWPTNAMTLMTMKRVILLPVLIATGIRDVVMATLMQAVVAACTVLFGFALGATLTSYWRRYRARRKARKERRQAKKLNGVKRTTWLEQARSTKLSANTQVNITEGDDAPVFTPEFKALFNAHAPQWTRDPSFSRLHWLNRIIDAAWPYIDTGVSKAVKAGVEPVVRELLPPRFVQWVGFEKFTLGPRAPTVTGIRTHKSHLENVIMDIELTWGSHPDIIFTLYVFGVRIPVKIRNMQVKVIMQVTFDPLVEVLPCIGAMEFCLTQMPEVLDFGLIIPPGIDLMSLPGVHTMVMDIVEKSLAPMMLYPYKLHMPLMPDSGIQASSTGMLRVKFISGSKFNSRRNYSKYSRKAGKSSGGFSRMLASDTYFVKYWTREQTSQSCPPRNGDTPVWEGTPETFVLCDRDSTLTLRLIKSGAERVSNYGECQITCSEIADRQGPVVLDLPFIEPGYFKEECPLDPLSAAEGYSPEQIASRNRDIVAWNTQAEVDAVQQRAKYFFRCAGAGASELKTKAGKEKKINHPTIKVELEYIDTGPPDDVTEEFEQGLLTVELVEARNLLRFEGKPPNPQVRVSCAKQYFDSVRKMRTSNPKWDNTRFVFYNVLADVDMLRFEVTGLDGVNLGYCEIDTAMVRANCMIRDHFRLQGVDKGELCLVLTYAPMAAKQAIVRTTSS